MSCAISTISLSPISQSRWNSRHLSTTSRTSPSSRPSRTYGRSRNMNKSSHPQRIAGTLVSSISYPIPPLSITHLFNSSVATENAPDRIDPRDPYPLKESFDWEKDEDRDEYIFTFANHLTENLNIVVVSFSASACINLIRPKSKTMEKHFPAPAGQKVHIPLWMEIPPEFTDLKDIRDTVRVYVFKDES